MLFQPLFEHEKRRMKKKKNQKESAKAEKGRKRVKHSNHLFHCSFQLSGEGRGWGRGRGSRRQAGNQAELELIPSICIHLMLPEILTILLPRHHYPGNAAACTSFNFKPLPNQTQTPIHSHHRIYKTKKGIMGNRLSLT